MGSGPRMKQLHAGGEVGYDWRFGGLGAFADQF